MIGRSESANGVRHFLIRLVEIVHVLRYGNEWEKRADPFLVGLR